ncbi:uncharacterized protein LOC127798326 isoform X2 [Diospyros lotus]|nr:uncharacterized protein LOC127798326 isoform X2 [Diospyros lotus]
MYEMEIHEGPRGPSFSITSTDGKSYSGQTPDIAWERFQKKVCPHIKLWHGKRYICKIDGVEFFGFKNAFVQRLLRELVANIGGTAETSCLTPSFRNEDSGTKYCPPNAESCSYPDLLPCLARLQVKGKRSKKSKPVNLNLTTAAKLKKPQPEDQVDFCNDPLALPAPVNLGTVVGGENSTFSAEDGLPLESCYSSNQLKVEVQPQKESRLVASENCKPTGIGGNSSMDDENLDRSRDAEVQGCTSSMAAEYKDEEMSLSKNTDNICDVDLCAPDTFDLLHDGMPDSQPTSQKKSISDETCDLVAQNAVISEGMGSESHPEEIRSSNASSRHSDFDSVGQEIAKSMMTVLLPQALPLLKIFSRKKKRVMSPPKFSTSGERRKKNDRIDHCVGVASSGTIEDYITGSTCSRQSLHNGISVKTGSPVDVCAPETNATKNLVLASEGQPTSSTDQDPCKRGPLPDEHPCSLHTEKRTFDGVHNTAPAISQNQEFLCSPIDKNNVEFLDTSASCTEASRASIDNELRRDQSFSDVSNSMSWLQSQGTSFYVYNREVTDGSSIKLQVKTEHNDEPETAVHSVGCYVHRLPVSLVLLITKEDEICICVLCGVSIGNDKTLFMYKLSLEEQIFGCPSFIGHTPILLPFSRDEFGRETALGTSSLQFTPDGHRLVLLNWIQTPYCREGRMQCPCSACRSDCFEQNAVKVVQVENGYVSIVVKLKTVDTVRCILVCEPTYLVGIEESGRLHLWVMNPTWSELIEECDLSTSDYIFPCITELKRIPNHAALVLGHNGFGEFGLWDLYKRIFLARFSSAGTTVVDFLPVSLSRWQRRSPVSIEPFGKEHIDEIMAATRNSFSEPRLNHPFIPIEGEDMAIWLLISTNFNSDVQHVFESSDHHKNPLDHWRLALLVKDRVIFGSALDPRAAAVGASACHGIIGTCDGLVYMWELSTGNKICDLHCFQGTGASCIATDNTKLGALAVAGGDQLLVYLQRKAAFLGQVGDKQVI